ncbi:hypothetical protein E4U33_001863, partial [Claviceps sp. LM78 group G4]
FLPRLSQGTANCHWTKGLESEVGSFGPNWQSYGVRALSLVAAVTVSSLNEMAEFKAVRWSRVGCAKSLRM